MDVKVEQFVSRAIRDPSVVVYPRLWRVWVDGAHAGVMGKQDGAKLLMHLRYPPEMQAEIEKEVAKQVAVLSGKVVEKVGSVVPAERVEPATLQDDGIDADDFQ